MAKTNRQVFEEVFNRKIESYNSPPACFLCPDEECQKLKCEDCRFYSWWDEEYKEVQDAEARKKKRET